MEINFYILSKVVNPLLQQLTTDGVAYTNEIKEFPTWYELYQGMFEFTHDAGGTQALVGGRLFTAEDIESNGDAIVNAMRSVVESPSGVSFGGHILNPGYANPTIDNAVHPAWRNAAASNLYIMQVPATNTLAERQSLEDQVTNALGQPLRDASPNSASYVNEVWPTYCFTSPLTALARVISTSQTGKRHTGKLYR